MSILTVALLQLASCGHDRAAATAKGEAACRQAAALGADIALFPEMWSAGYTFFTSDDPASRAAWEAQSIGRDDHFVTHFRSLAMELDMAIALTYLERWEGRPRNTVSLIDRRGNIMLTYAKVHTCEFDVEAALTPGDGFPVCSLETRQGVVQVGAMICYDREFPESARILMLGSAELILVPNACTLEDSRLSQFKTRALENMVGLAMANYAPPAANGHSCAYDGMAYTAFEGREGERDHKVIEAGDVEGIYPARFDLERMRAYRAYETWGNSYRRPRLYGALVDEAVRPPFVRPDATR